MNCRLHTGLALATAPLAFALAAPTVRAAPTLLTSASQLSSSDKTAIYADPAGTVEPSGYTVIGPDGNTLTFTDAGSGFFRTTEHTGWFGNFASGAPLLWNGYPGPMYGPDTITFSSPVTQVGLQAQNDYYGTFTLTIYDNNNVLDTYSVNGTSSNANDDTAPFIGLEDTAITSITISTGQSNNGGPYGTVNDFTIGQVTYGYSASLLRNPQERPSSPSSLSDWAAWPGGAPAGAPAPLEEGDKAGTNVQ